jgi:ubiquitin-protein ligase
MLGRVNIRLQKEEQMILKQKEFTLVKDNSDCLIWYITFQCSDESIYKGEKYTLKFLFNGNYVN